MNKSKTSEIEMLLVSSPGVLNYSPKKYFEVQPGRMSPIFINIKNTLSNIELRELIAKKLLKNLPKDIDFICGIESGGSYYASIIADKLSKPLVLYRKNDKTYAEKGNFVGTIPSKQKKVAIIDDVIVSGKTVEPAINQLRNYGCKVYVNAILSYGHEEYVEKKLSINVFTVTTINELLNAAVAKKLITLKDANFLIEFTSKQKKDFMQRLKNRKVT